MEMLNKIELIGIVGSVRTDRVQNADVMNFSLVTEYVDRFANTVDTMWHKCVAYNVAIDNGKAEDIMKGTALHIIGRLRSKRYVNADGKEQSFTEVIVKRMEIVEHDK